jgi:hypothetical protein
MALNWRGDRADANLPGGEEWRRQEGALVGRTPCPYDSNLRIWR